MAIPTQSVVKIHLIIFVDTKTSQPNMEMTLQISPFSRATQKCTPFCITTETIEYFVIELLTVFFLSLSIAYHRYHFRSKHSVYKLLIVIRLRLSPLDNRHTVTQINIVCTIYLTLFISTLRLYKCYKCSSRLLCVNIILISHALSRCFLRFLVNHSFFFLYWHELFHEINNSDSWEFIYVWAYSADRIAADNKIKDYSRIAWNRIKKNRANEIGYDSISKQFL